jgi:hypothetical protein
VLWVENMDESEGILDEFKGWLEDPSESLFQYPRAHLPTHEMLLARHYLPFSMYLLSPLILATDHVCA